MKQDENDALIRLADSLCGFVRAATEGQEEMRVPMNGRDERDVSGGHKKTPVVRGNNLALARAPTNTGSIRLNLL